MEQPNVSKTSNTKLDSIKIYSDVATIGEDKELQKYDPSLKLLLESFKFADFTSPPAKREFSSIVTYWFCGGQTLHEFMHAAWCQPWTL